MQYAGWIFMTDSKDNKASIWQLVARSSKSDAIENIFEVKPYSSGSYLLSLPFNWVLVLHLERHKWKSGFAPIDLRVRSNSCFSTVNIHTDLQRFKDPTVTSVFPLKTSFSLHNPLKRIYVNNFSRSTTHTCIGCYNITKISLPRDVPCIIVKEAFLDNAKNPFCSVKSMECGPAEVVQNCSASNLVIHLTRFSIWTPPFHLNFNGNVYGIQNW